MTIGDWKDRFGPFGDQVWLNSAHQGPLPRIAAAAAREAIEWKVSPFEMTTERFSGVPRRLKTALARLIHAEADDIILANSASYGLHLLANGIPWRDGDEVLVMRGDFPSDILPWLGLASRGVSVRYIEPRRRVVQPDELRAAIGPRTRAFCTTWVHSLSGFAIDLDALGQICRDRGVLFIANCSQALGVRPLDVMTAPVDAITSVGFKWLLGPYGTGFCWIRPDVRESLTYNQAYWLSMQTADDLGAETLDVRIEPHLGARKFDIFGTANFFNFVPWTASIELMLEIGVEAARDHDAALVDRLITGIDRDRFSLKTPERGPERSTLVFISHRDPERNAAAQARLRDAGIAVAYRAGALRFAPHVHNTDDDIERALAILRHVGRD